ncbi:MAG: guanylate kinase [Kiritimatiellae bacterium]|nr:guanylate kinase [Kiritimatiellia bacterium]
MKPLLIVISAPSGAGKTTICDLLLRSYPEISYSVSCTTREPRLNEVDGEDYHFLTQERFRQLIGENMFLEYAEVHGNYYGTLKQPIYDVLKEGHAMLLDIDVQGAEQVRRTVSKLPQTDLMRQGYMDIFINPPSIEELRNRLEKRGTDDPEVIEHRLENAAAEMERAGEYMYQVVNDDLRICFQRVCDIINIKGEFV